MKFFRLFVFTIISTLSFSNVMAQSLSGKWEGKLEIQGISIPLVFHIQESEEDGWAATMDSPDQGVRGLKVDQVTFQDSRVLLNLKSMGIQYEGEINEAYTLIDGKLIQSGFPVPLILERKGDPIVLNRPQTPKPPFPYHQEEVEFENEEADIRLAGTFFKPKDKTDFPTVVIISGSGAQDRNFEIAGHKIYLVLADYLVRQGIAVLRYDERGVGASEGFFAFATTADLASDVKAAIRYLQSREDVNEEKIGLIGHSEGGIIAPMLAAEVEDVRYIAMLAGPGVGSDTLMLQQTEAIYQLQEDDPQKVDSVLTISSQLYAAVKNIEDMPSLRDSLLAIFQANSEGTELQFNQQIAGLMSPWYRYFIKIVPSTYLTKVKCPVLVLNGDKDLQVLAEPNTEGIRKALEKGGNEQVAIQILPNLNHLFQTSETGDPSEYTELDETFAPVAMKAIADWINSLSFGRY
jgi:pimeloyl-ACP methyl ester carboxylesterase